MPADPLTVMPAIDPTVLTDVVRHDQRNRAFDILTWTIGPLSHEKIIDTTGGLFLLSGTGRDDHGTQSWSIVLKILNNPKEWAQDPRSWAYWKRELLAFQSGLLATLPIGLSAPRCYGTTYNVPQNPDKKRRSLKVHHLLCVNSTPQRSKPSSCVRC